MKNTEISKAQKAILTAEKRLTDQALKLRSICTHTNNGTFMIIQNNHNNMFTCTICGDDEIDFSVTALSKEEIEKHLHIILSVANIVKMRCNHQNPKDMAYLEEIGKMIYCFRKSILPVYFKLQKKDKNRSNTEFSKASASWDNFKNI